jgi:hypothetical protein
VDRNLDLTIWRELGTVSVIRRFIEELYEQIFDDLDVVSRIALVAHELLENAVKYSRAGSARIQIRVEEHGADRRISIQVSNDATPDNLATLRAAMAEMDAAEDPMLHYQILMRRNSKRRDGSGLGLARVVAEGETTLGLIIEDERASLRALMTIEGRAS